MLCEHCSQLLASNFSPSHLQLFYGMRKFLRQVVAAGSVTVAYPFDTVRRRLMMMSGEKEKMYKVTAQCLN